jgi:hypothetical protein
VYRSRPPFVVACPVGDYSGTVARARTRFESECREFVDPYYSRSLQKVFYQKPERLVPEQPTEQIQIVCLHVVTTVANRQSDLGRFIYCFVTGLRGVSAVFPREILRQIIVQS